MIPSEFYAQVYYNANTKLGCTAHVPEIPIEDAQYTNAYWLGWISSENLSPQYKISEYKLTNGVVSFTDITRQENVPIGYWALPNASFSRYDQTTSVLAHDGTKYNRVTGDLIYTSSGDIRLANSLDVNTAAANGIYLGFFGFAGNSEIYGSVFINITNFIADTTTSVTFSNGYTLTFKPSDFNEYAIKEFTANDVNYRIVLAMYYINMLRDNNTSGNVADYGNIKPMVRVQTTYDDVYIQGVTQPVQYDYRDTLRFAWGSGRTGQGAFITKQGNLSTNMVYKSRTGHVDVMGGYEGEFAVGRIPVYGIDVPSESNFYLRGIDRNDIAIIGRVFTYDEIYKTISLFPRWCINGNNKYENGTNYFYSLVDYDSNEFLTDFVAGNEYRRLTDWQIIGGNISDNDFEESDIPIDTGGDREYNDEEKFTGGANRPVLPDIPGFNGFITQYAFTGAQLSSFANRFWNRLVTWDVSTSSFTWNTEFVDNFIIALADTGTLDISNLLEYIVSIQVFPFNLATMPTYSQVNDSSVYMGAGILPVIIDGIPGTLNTMAVQLGGNGYQFRPRFNDFRDFTATSIELYVPFCGSISIDPNMAYNIIGGNVVGNWIRIWYGVDLQTGHLTAFVDLERPDTETGGANITTLAVLEGKCSAQVPVSAGVAGQMVSRMIGTIGTGIVAAGSIAEKAGTHLESTPETEALSNKLGVTVKREAQNNTGIIGEARRSINTFANASPFSPGRISASPLADMFMQCRYPYVTYRTGRYHTPVNYSHTYGKQFLFNTTVGSVSNNGFLKCANVDCSGLTAQADEKSEIKALLESGVYL